ncbi:MAG TPA: YfhO family protein, partial [Anaerolineae bacterium]|nr:YfhO family protein [Anaerolineae bacterium]
DWLLGIDASARKRGLISVLSAAIVIGVAYAILRVPALPARPDRLSYVQTQEGEFLLWLIGGAIVLSIGVLWPRWGALVLAGVCGLVLIQLWPLAAAYQQPISTRYYYPATPAIDRLTQDQDLFRVLTTRRDWSNWPFKPDLPALYNLQDVGGYDSQYLLRYVNYVKAINQSGPPEPYSNFLAPTHFDSPLVDLLNVKYAMTLDKVQADGWELIDKTGMRIYQRTNPLPRAWIVDRAEVIADDAAILDRLADPGFHPRQTVVLEQTPREPLGEIGTDPAGTVNIESYANTRLVLNAEMQRAGWLVLSEVFYPGWRVTVDGVAASLYRADYILRAVPLAAGAHRIEMWFMPASFASGAIISLATVVLLSLLGFSGWRRERRQIHAQVQ